MAKRASAIESDLGRSSQLVQLTDVHWKEGGRLGLACMSQPSDGWIEWSVDLSSNDINGI